MTDYRKIPEWWPMCPNENCPMAADCLRQRVCREAPAEVTRWMCVMPNALSNGKCSYYQKAEKVTIARGMKHLFDKVKDRKVRKSLRLEMTDYLGSKGTYYRYKDGERLINPELQQWIQDLFRRYGVEEQVLFDEYFETYDFTHIES